MLDRVVSKKLHSSKLQEALYFLPAPTPHNVDLPRDGGWGSTACHLCLDIVILVEVDPSSHSSKHLILLLRGWGRDVKFSLPLFPCNEQYAIPSHM